MQSLKTQCPLSPYLSKPDHQGPFFIGACEHFILFFFFFGGGVGREEGTSTQKGPEIDILK